MRDIKFRAWDKWHTRCEDDPSSMVEETHRVMIKLNGNVYNSEYGDNQNDRYIIMQYTGLKDKNGKDIYEGDIVFIVKDKFGENKDDIWAIEYDTSTASFVAFNQLNSIRSIYESYRGVGFNIIDDFSIIEIIGNIYENPELLENK